MVRLRQTAQTEGRKADMRASRPHTAYLPTPRSSTGLSEVRAYVHAHTQSPLGLGASLSATLKMLMLRPLRRLCQTAQTESRKAGMRASRPHTAYLPTPRSSTGLSEVRIGPCVPHSITSGSGGFTLCYSQIVDAMTDGSPSSDCTDRG